MTVTKQQQLEWLAKNVSQFPYGFHMVFASAYCVGVLVGLLETEKHIITREEWQQERDKMRKQQEMNISGRLGDSAFSVQSNPDNSWHERGELPPVGATVEKKCKSATIWTDIKIVAAGNQLVIFGYPDGDESVGEWSDYEFRPLRTEREKAIDEMADLISKSVFGSAKCQAEKLYDAGYRKVSQ